MPKAKNLTLSKSQAACLIALRHGKDFKTKIAIEAGLDLVKTAAALGALTRLGLAEQGETRRWHMSARGNYDPKGGIRVPKFCTSLCVQLDHELPNSLMCDTPRCLEFTSALEANRK